MYILGKLGGSEVIVERLVYLSYCRVIVSIAEGRLTVDQPGLSVLRPPTHLTSHWVSHCVSHCVSHRVSHWVSHLVRRDEVKPHEG